MFCREMNSDEWGRLHPPGASGAAKSVARLALNSAFVQIHEQAC